MLACRCWIRLFHILPVSFELDRVLALPRFTQSKHTIPYYISLAGAVRVLILWSYSFRRRSINHPFTIHTQFTKSFFFDTSSRLSLALQERYLLVYGLSLSCRQYSNDKIMLTSSNSYFCCVVISGLSYWVTSFKW